LSDSLSRFLSKVGPIAAAGLLLLGIVNSAGLSEVQKYFAGTLVLIVLVLVYAETTFEKKKDKEKAVKPTGSKEDGEENGS
jgi:hypothetical protein